MQISQSHRFNEPNLRPGELVLVRRARWRIVRVCAHDRCRVVTLSGLAPANAGVERRVLIPFDRIEKVVRRSRPRIVGAEPWRRACRATIAAEDPPGSLRSARTAHIDLLPHQLEPAMAAVRGLATRILLADEVGLGKTIQAGLVAAELLARGAIDRVLVLTPPGLCDQWRTELTTRFAIDAVLADAHTLRRLSRELPIGVSPWQTLTAAVASIDYVKRPEVFPSVSARRWDLVILDEAHGCVGDSDRRAAAHSLAASAAYALLLSATPHNGDRDAFASLCGIGAIDAPTGAVLGNGVADVPLLVFRRTRADAGLDARRRVHILGVRPSDGEARMHALLGRYHDAVRAETADRAADTCLALSVLHKRALSSAWSLARSIERRLADLAADGPAPALQLALPLLDHQGELIAADDAPAWPAGLGLSNRSRERRLLSAVLASAQRAAGAETKLAVLVRLLRRASQPAVVFTEYRDTLQHVRQRLPCPALVLHGGLTRQERTAVLASFENNPHALLLATDAAAEGLNLHHRCRLIVNLELPWNPMRLEQRIGRVDRIGQRRTVHAFHLVALGTGETRLLSRLRARLAAADADIGAPDPLDDQRHVARFVLEPEEVS
jgi:superfamily II DNA or RNA helicase